MDYKRAIVKRNLELVGMFPFVLLGKIAGHIFKLSTRHNVFLFFPWADIGGSIKVNADIAACVKDARPLVIFSKKPRNNEFRKLFDIDGVRVIDLHRYIDKKPLHFINFFFRGVLATWINKAEKPVVFGGESMFFYKVIPHLRKEIRKIELCHLNTWFDFSQAYVEYIDARIFSSPQIKRDVETQYKQNKVPALYYNRLFFADNKVDIPAFQIVKNDELQVVFVGRGAPQKRVHLLAAIAKRMHDSGVKVHFSFVGDVESLIPDEVKSYTTLYGNLDKERLYQVYAQSDVLLLTSAFEGLPIVVMDMMARGKVVVSTAVGGIPDYIEHGRTGFLTPDADEETIIRTSIEYLEKLAGDESLRLEIGRNAYQFAAANFGEEQFCNTYRSFILGQIPVQRPR
jgi:glycosyltransferase involved in cell wall biosynthesis